MAQFDYSSIPIGYYDKVLADGLERKRGIQSAWHHLKFKSVKESLGNYSKHLDVACGPGTFIGRYLDNRSEGIDVSKYQIEYAQKNYSSKDVRFFVGDVNKNTIDFKKYDVITLLEFIEHISKEEVDKLLETLYGMLNHDGRIILTTPNYIGLWPILEKLVGVISSVSYKDQHINRYTVNRIKKELDYSSITIKKYINFGIFMSYFNHELGLKFHEIISILFKNFFGYSLLITIKKTTS